MKWLSERSPEGTPVALVLQLVSGANRFYLHKQFPKLPEAFVVFFNECK